MQHYSVKMHLDSCWKTKLLLKEVALYIALFLRASLLCFHLSLDVVIMKRMRLTHTQPLFSSPLFPAQ